MKSLNCMVYEPETGMYRYDQELNRLLISDLTSETYLFFRWVRNHQDNSRHATPEAAVAFVRALNAYFGGGFSLAEPESSFGGLFGFGRCVWSAPAAKIAGPAGEFYAGLIGRACGNEAMCASEAQRDGEIYHIIGLTYPNLKPREVPAGGWLSERILQEALNA